MANAGLRWRRKNRLTWKWLLCCNHIYLRNNFGTNAIVLIERERKIVTNLWSKLGLHRHTSLLSLYSKIKKPKKSGRNFKMKKKTNVWVSVGFLSNLLLSLKPKKAKVIIVFIITIPTIFKRLRKNKVKCFCVWFQHFPWEISNETAVEIFTEISQFCL